MKTRTILGTLSALALIAAGCGGSDRAQVDDSSGAATSGGSLKIQYRTYLTGSTNQIAPILNLVNGGTSAVTLSAVTIRYWFTADGTQPIKYFCDYTARGCANVTSTLAKVASPVATADSYLELGFTSGAGTLAAGKSTGELMGRMARSNWSSFDQSNDYSYGGAKPSSADWDRVTVYLNGALVWGVEPIATTPVQPTTLTDADYAAFLSANQDLTFDLLRGLAAAKGEQNLVFSSTSISYALSMTYAGAAGATAAEMAQALRLQLPQSLVPVAFGRLAKDLASRAVPEYTDGNGTVKSLSLDLADAVWFQNGFPINSAYSSLLQSAYGAPPQFLDFVGAPDASRVTINDWVARQTQQKILDLLPSGSIGPETRLVLANAVYFKASWQSIFYPKSTSQGTFHAATGADVAVQMMHASGHMKYAAGDGYQLLQLPYVGGKLDMTIVLPEASRFAELRKAMSSAWLQTALASVTTSADVVLALPKFKLAPDSFSIATQLQALGMHLAFSPDTADFTGISPSKPLWISDVLHKAFISIDESGTEAAAATAVMMSGTSMPTQIAYFTADHPFFFFIHDASGTLLFAGQVMQP